MSKINILVIPSDKSGVSGFRSIEPHLKLQELYPDEFHVEILPAGTDTFDWSDTNYLKQFQIIHFHRTLFDNINGQIQPVYGDRLFQILDNLKKLGIITIMDIDDYWEPTKEHPAYSLIIQSGLPKRIVENLGKVDYVTTTTEIYAKNIRKINKNVMVLPNTIDPNISQFKPNPEPTDKKVRFGWLGGSSHLHDLHILHGVVNRLRQDEDMLKETQMVLCGFDTRGTVTMTNPNTGQNETRKIQPHESVWCRYEEIFTDNYKSLSPEYIKELRKFNKETNYNDKNEPYRRVWTKPITSYATNYNLFDVSIVPLVPHIFNMNKSQLKVVEAAFHKKCLVAQDFGPYQIDMVNNKNGILIKSERNHKDWFETMKKLYKNPNMVTDLGEQLYEDLHIKYHIDTVTKSRRDYYLELVNSNVLV